MIRNGLFASVVLIGALFWVALGVAVWKWRGAVADLRAAEAQVAGYEEAARWYREDAVRVKAAAALDETLRTGEGANEPLSDYLRNGAGRVWP
jgi:hypothetical protein